MDFNQAITQANNLATLIPKVEGFLKENNMPNLGTIFVNCAPFAYLPYLQWSMGKRFDKVDERLDEVDERFDKRFDKVDERFDKVDERFDKVDAGAEDSREKLEELSKVVSYIKGKIDAAMLILSKIFLNQNPP